MDIKSKSVTETGFLHLRDADDTLMYEGESRADEARVGITLYSPGSRQGQRALANQNNRMMEKIRQKGKVKQSAAEKNAEQAEFLVEVTAGFQNLDYPGENGQPLSGKELYRAVYTDPLIGFVPDQAAKYFGEWGNFLPSAPKASSDT